MRQLDSHAAMFWWQDKELTVLTPYYLVVFYNVETPLGLRTVLAHDLLFTGA